MAQPAPACVFCGVTPPVGPVYASGCQRPRYACYSCAHDSLMDSMYALEPSKRPSGVLDISLSRMGCAQDSNITDRHKDCGVCDGHTPVLIFDEDEHGPDAKWRWPNGVRKFAAVDATLALQWMQPLASRPIVVSRHRHANKWSCGCGWMWEVATSGDPWAVCELAWLQHKLNCKSLTWKCDKCSQVLYAPQATRAAFLATYVAHLQGGTCSIFWDQKCNL